MKQNSLQLEDTCLTIEQIKILQELGIDLKNSIFVICNETDEILYRGDIFGSIGDNYTPTLTNTEMLEMLPNSVESVMLEIHYWQGWNVRYYGISEVQDGLLRNVLFETIKYLKTNKLM